MVQRYVLQNPVRSGLAASINDWAMVKLVSERRDKTSLDVFWAERRKPRGIRQCQRTDALTDEIAAPWLATARDRPEPRPMVTPRCGATITTTLRKFRHLRSRHLYCCLRTPAGNKSEQPAV